MVCLRHNLRSVTSTRLASTSRWISRKRKNGTEKLTKMATRMPRSVLRLFRGPKQFHERSTRRSLCRRFATSIVFHNLRCLPCPRYHHLPSTCLIRLDSACMVPQDHRDRQVQHRIPRNPRHTHRFLRFVPLPPSESTRTSVQTRQLQYP